MEYLMTQERFQELLKSDEFKSFRNATTISNYRTKRNYVRRF